MRHIKNDCLQTMHSPIRFVMCHIHEALVNVAPEREADFQKKHADFTLEYVDSDRFICETDMPAKYIRLSRQVVELHWAASYGYMTLYTKVVQVHKPTTKQVIDLTRDPELAQAMRLLRWAYVNWTTPENQTPWPSDLPKPIEVPTSGSMEHVADELALCAIAACLHHELAHIRLDHRGPSSIEKEREADAAMADWILDHDLPLEDLRFIKRSLGIAIALEALTAYGIYTGKFGGKTHPFSFDRLVNTISRYVTDANHVVWAVLVSTLKLHLDNQKKETPDVVYNTFRDCVNAFADVLSR